MHKYTGNLKYRKQGISWHTRVFLYDFLLNILPDISLKLFLVLFIVVNQEKSKHSQILRNLINLQAKFLILKEFQAPLKWNFRFQHFSRSSRTCKGPDDETPTFATKHVWGDCSSRASHRWHHSMMCSHTGNYSIGRWSRNWIWRGASGGSRNRLICHANVRFRLGCNWNLKARWGHEWGTNSRRQSRMTWK